MALSLLIHDVRCMDASVKYTVSRLFFFNVDLLHSSIWLNMFDLIHEKMS